MNAKTVFLTGANRGIGLQMVTDLLKLNSPPKTLIATCRDPEKATELQEIALINKNVKIIKLDILADMEEEGLKRVVNETEQLLNGDGLNLLINNAGVAPKTKNPINLQLLTDVYTVNAFAPLLLIKAFQPLLERAATQNAMPDLSINRAAVVNISSILGSIANNTQGGLIIYKSSKAALNMMTNTFAHSLGPKGILLVAMHPGWVKTDMGGERAKLSKEDSVAGMFETIAKCNGEHNGKLLSFEGNELPW